MGDRSGLPMEIQGRTEGIPPNGMEDLASDAGSTAPGKDLGLRVSWEFDGLVDLLAASVANELVALQRGDDVGVAVSAFDQGDDPG